MGTSLFGCKLELDLGMTSCSFSCLLAKNLAHFLHKSGLHLYTIDLSKAYHISHSVCTEVSLDLAYTNCRLLNLTFAFASSWNVRHDVMVANSVHLHCNYSGKVADIHVSLPRTV